VTELLGHEASSGLKEIAGIWASEGVGNRSFRVKVKTKNRNIPTSLFNII
jgi:hypothetical protein